MVLKAACDGLVELKDTAADERLLKMLAGPLTPTRRAAIIAALARLKPGDGESLTRLYGELDNDRASVRRAAIETLAEVGDFATVAKLQDLRQQEDVPRMIQTVDAALVKLRARLAEDNKLQTEFEKLRQQNADLLRRLEKLEQGGKK